MRDFFSWFGENSVLGVPLDIPAHFVVGAILTLWLVRGLRVSWKSAFLVVLTAAIGKEIFDFPVILKYTHTYWEPVKDVGVTLAGTLILQPQRQKRFPAKI